MLSGPLRLLLLTSSTGGGHDMRARSLRQWATAHTPWTVSTQQVLEETHALYRFGVSTYNLIQRRMPALHHAYFGFLELAAMHRKAARIINAASFRERVAQFAPDVVVSTHAHLNHGFFELARNAMTHAPVCVTYCGELSGGYGFSRHWVNPDADAFIAAVETTRHAALDLGMRAARTLTGGFMLDPRFYAERCGASLRAHFMRDTLQLDPDRFTLLLATGASGANNHLRVLQALQMLPRAPQVIALCGRDEALPAGLQDIASQHRDMPLRALGHSNEMPMLMQCADAIFARPGTGTTSEAMVSGCPIIFNRIGGAMPQERITLLYARQQGFGAVVREAGALPGSVDRWMQADGTLAAEREAMRRATPPGHPLSILEYVARLAAERP